MAWLAMTGADHHKASPGQIWRQAQNIIQANKEEHPELLKNPHLLHDGTKLHIPGQDNTQGSLTAPGGNQHEAHQRRATHRHTGDGHPAEAGRPHKHKGGAGGAPDGGAPDDPAQKRPADQAKDPVGDAAKEVAGAVGHAADQVAGAVGHALTELGNGLAHIATNVAHQLGTIGDCAHGPRLALGKLGYHLPPAVATEQGRMIRNSGLFDEVPRSQVRPGDYGVRDWNSHVIREHGGVNKGDSFIVTSVDRHGHLYGANDRTFAVPADGGRYRNLRFYRPNAEFLRRYGNGA
jgi:hypothetical protein